MHSQPSHVALLVRSVEHAAKYLSRFGFSIGDSEIWEGEGTREIYVERDKENSLLLMEPVRSGAYQRALEKRGPGLHHLAIDVLDLEAYMISMSGWLLHPKSIKTIRESKTAYLARPGFPALIEVQEKAELESRARFVGEIGIAYSDEFSPLIQKIGLGDIVRQTSGEPWIGCGGQKILFSDIL